jgi:putative ABC transport system permease protein
MDTFWQDVRFGVRMLKKNPGVTALAIVALALGIGVNTSIFSLINAVLLRPLPYREPGQLVQMTRVQARAAEGPNLFDHGAVLAGADYLDWKEQSKTLSHVAGFDGEGVNLTGGERAERIESGNVTWSFFELLGVQPILGRAFLPEEDIPNSSRVVMLTHGLWKRRYSGDPEIVGKSIQVEGQAVTVVGVLPAGFVFREPFEMYRPIALDPVSERGGQRMRMLEILGRLKLGVTMEQARAELETILNRARPQLTAEPGMAPGGGQRVTMPLNGPPPGSEPVMKPIGSPPSRIQLTGWHEQLVGNLRGTLIILLAAVAFVLLIACANVANLLLARASARQKEIAIRTALGAARWRIIRQLLTESALLAVGGAALGLMLAYWSMDLARVYASAHLTVMRPIAIDRWVLAFTALVALGTGIVFGLAPAFQAAAAEVNESLKEGSRTGGASASRNRFRSTLVIVESALAVVLLAGAGLLFRSFMELRNQDKGFKPESVLTASIVISENPAEDPDEAQFAERLLARVKTFPGVEAAAITDHLPLTDYSMMMMTSMNGETHEQSASCYVSATPEFFSALRIQLVDGRVFDSRDGRAAPLVVVVNEKFVKQFIDDKKNPIGQKINPGSPDGSATIVGVVKDVVSRSIEGQAMPEVYRPFAQSPNRRMRLVARSSGDMTALTAAIRGAVRSIDPNQPVYEIMTMEERLAGAFAPRRLNLILLGVFAALAMVLSAVGIYGVMSYVVSQRTHEIGVRMALGAQRADILNLIIKQGIGLVAIGVAAGAIAALALTRTLRSLLYGISPQDPVTFVIIPLLLLAVAFVACWFPARKATQADPINALRCE